MKLRLPFLLATLGFTLAIFPAYRLANSGENNDPMPQDVGERHSSASLEKRDIQEGDTLYISLAGKAGVAFLEGALGQEQVFVTPGKREEVLETGATVLIWPTKVIRVDDDIVRVEKTEHPDLDLDGSDNYRLEFQCTLLREKITYRKDAKTDTRKDTVGDADSSGKPQSGQAQITIHDFEECPDYKIQLWKRLLEMEK